MLLHPRPRTVCVLGLGSGVTVGGALRHPVERVDVLEISPEVVAASGHFAAENHDALKDPRTRVIVGDGRSHLLLSADRYDVIISEPSNPWLAGVAPLFTREFLEGARQHLMPGGILCQWTHTYQMTPRDLRSIVATFVVLWPIELGEKADPFVTPEGIKPEWYFLSTYQLLKYFPKLLGILVSFIPPLVLLLWPFLDRSPERHPKKRPIAVGIGIAALVLAIAFGVVGHFSESKVTFRGKTYHIDIYGMPHQAPPAGAPEQPPAKP
jgi:hypothetical protein